VNVRGEGKKALVTGGAGFLGSHVADALTRRGFDVAIFDRAPSRWASANQRCITGDITNPDDVRAAVEGMDAVYHLAALADLNAGKTRPVETARVNIMGTLNVLEALRANANAVEAKRTRLMFASTVYVYSREGGFYRCSKQACESYIDEYARSYGVEYTVLRYGSLYGPRADESNGIFRLLRAAIDEGAISYGGGPDDVREYIHVEDAASLSVDALADDHVNKHLVLTGSAPLRAAELFTMFGEILGKDVAVHYAHKKEGHYAVTPYAYTPKPGKKMTANPFVDMGQGLLHVIEELQRVQRGEVKK
jgi:UDP-glucose 4-epimerase